MESKELYLLTLKGILKTLKGRNCLQIDIFSSLMMLEGIILAIIVTRMAVLVFSTNQAW